MDRDFVLCLEIVRTLVIILIYLSPKCTGRCAFGEVGGSRSFPLWRFYEAYQKQERALQ